MAPAAEGKADVDASNSPVELRSPSATEGSQWSLFSDQRPTDRSKLYAFRVEGLNIEWKGGLQNVGMGHGDNEYWPDFSHWNGYERTLPKGFQWRVADVGAKPDELKFTGLNLLPCPFCGGHPKVEGFRSGNPGGGGGVFVHSGPWEWNTFVLRPCCRLVASSYFACLGNLETAWNRRKTSTPQSSTSPTPTMEE